MKTLGRLLRPGTVDDLLQHAAFHLVGFAVAVLPERVKVKLPWCEYSTVSAHVASGVSEVLGGVALFGAGLLPYVTSFSRGAGYTYVAHQPTLHHSDFFAVGALGYLSYLLHPVAIVSLYVLGEGTVRALDAALTGRRLGLAFLSVPHWVFLRLRRLAAKSRLEHDLGPARPDVVLLPEATPDGRLVIVSRDRKEWSDVQVVELGGRFYQLTAVELVREGALLSWRYRFRTLDPAEIIRGDVVRLEAPRAPRPRQGGDPAPPGEPRHPLTGRLVRRR